MEELYRAVYTEEDENGEVYGISIVDLPANQFEFIALSEMIETIKLANIAKRTITGVVLAPEQLIKRKFNNSNEYYNLKFEADTIETISQDFLKKGYQRNTTFNHEDDKWLEGTSIVESWIVNDPSNDKSNSLGLKNVPKGSWVVTMKLSEALWSEYIVTGKAKGFSIDSFLKIQKIKQKKQEKMSILKELVKLFSDKKEEKVELASIQVDEFGILVADSFTEGQTVFREEENGNVIEAANISFMYEGTSFQTDENGVIVSATLTPMEEANITEAEVAEVTEEATTEVAKVEIEAVDPTLALQATIDELTISLAEEKAKNEELKRENELLSNIPADFRLKSQSVKQTKVGKESTLEAIRRITNN